MVCMNRGHRPRPCDRRSRGLFFRSGGRPLSRAEQGGILALGSAALLALLAPALQCWPLIFFVLAALFAPFFPGWGFFYPLVSHGPRDRPELGLSFDDGPDPESTPLVLALLRRHGFRATFFVNGRKVRRHPQLVEAILAEGHELGNHSYSHDDCIMFRHPDRLVREMALTQRALARHGVRPTLFRPPVGINVPAYAEALHRCGLTAVNFSCRGRDMGNRRYRGLAGRILKRLRPGDIVLLHDLPPPQGGEAAREQWLAELESICIAVKKRGLTVVPLPVLCGCAGMQRLETDGGSAS